MLRRTYIALFPNTMWTTVFRAIFTKAPPTFLIPEGQRVYAIGDVHGCLTQLEALVAAIDADHAARPSAQVSIIFIGDLVDRGPASKGVIDFVAALAASRPDVRFLKGNHEEILLLAAQGDRQLLSLFDRVGGRETLLSYGVDPDVYDQATLNELAELIVDAIPKAHLDFIETFEDQVTVGDYVFVHAGIRPGRPIAEQQPSDLRWIRDAFLNHRGQHGAMIVHGHSISDEPELLTNRIGIDTGAYRGGKLTALGLEGSEKWILQA